MQCFAKFHSIDEKSAKDEIRTAEALLWGLAYATDGTDEHIQIALDADVAAPLVNILRQQHSNFESLQAPALRAIGNISSGTDVQMDVILNAGVCQVLKTYLYNPSKAVKKDALWTISNIGAGTESQIQMLFTSGLLQEALPFLADTDYDLLKDTIYIFANALLGGTDTQRETFCGGTFKMIL